ncbi:uncharacterized protein LOC124307769 [Neodiprion virginianus]|uniref:uncharacterized protein LOC124307769 n=1 Tax=Neodiprion virginianus TaxID=2961670 RepID=UPI001EE731E8|nr:uncharacterized protein LOC124307769 [Neodiprion virginianus]
MSSPSLNESSPKNLENSTTDNESEQVSTGRYNSSIQHISYTRYKFSAGSIQQRSIHENDCDSTIQSERTIVSLLSSSVDSVNEKMNPAVASEDAITSTKQLQTAFHSFTSHKLSNYDQNVSTASSKIVETPLEADLHLSLAEEQDADTVVHGIKNLSSAKGHAANRDPIENLVLATLAFKETSFNQCDLLRAQTSAINRLATAIEDQNIMMNRFHTFACKASNSNLLDKNNS